MLNKTYVSLEGLGHFRDTILVSSINIDNSFIAVPAGTKAKSYNIYYKEVSGSKIKANPQPTEGSTLPGNTYWVLGPGSPDDETRAASVSAVVDYVDDIITNDINPSINSKVSSVWYNTDDKTLGYSNGGNHDVVTFGANAFTSTSIPTTYAGSSSAGGAATSANKINTDAGSATQPVYFNNGIPVSTTYSLEKSVPSNAVFTDTHYTATPVLASTTSGTSNATTDASNPYLNIVENSAKSGGIQVKGDGATKVTAKDGVLTVSSTDTTNFAGLASGESSGGKAQSAANAEVSIKLGTSDVGSATKGIYLDDGVPTACTYSVAKDVPSNAIFTDTVYTHPTTTAHTAAAVKVGNDGEGHVVLGAAITPSDIGASADGHTHNYAGSTSAGGVANEAAKLVDSVDIGSATQPVYFLDGLPVATTYSLEKSVPSNAVFTDTHYTANAVLTSTDSGTSGATSDTTNAATYLNVIENGSKSSGIQITGTGATTVSAKNGKLTINSTNSTNFAGLASGESSGGKAATAAQADVATKLGTSDKGSATQPIYLDDGEPKACTYTIEKSVPSNAVFTDTVYTHPDSDGYHHVPATGTENGGRVLVAGSTAGSEAWTTLSDAGIAAKVHTHNYAGSSSAGGAATSANKLNTDAGSATQPVYFNNGVPSAITYSLEKSVPSNAVFTDTHYTATPILASTAAGTSGATTDASDPYLNIIENSAKSGGIQIKGAGATTVTANSGVLTISSTDTTVATKLGTTDVGSGTKGIYLDDGVPKACTYSVGIDVPSNAVFTDTHYTAIPVLASATDGTSNATSDATNPYLNVVENSAKSGGIQITGSGATTVTAKNGVLTISSTDTTVATKLGTTDVGSGTKGIYLDDGVPKACTYSVGIDVPSNAVFTDTHYTANAVLAGTNSAVANATSDTTNGATYLNIAENSTKSSSIQIIGSGATTVSAKNGVLTINSTDTTTATKLGTSDVGSSTKGIYLDDGVPKACTYAVNKDVPSNAVFTDTTYTNLSEFTDDLGTSPTHTHSQYATLESPELTGTPKAPTAAVGTKTTQIATTAYVKAEIDSVLQASDAMRFKGTVGTGGTVATLPNNHSCGDTYKVLVAGSYAGKTCEVGDMIICVKDGTTASNDDWTVVQNNIDGAVTGPGSSTDGNFALFNGTSGKVIKNSSYSPSSFAASSHNHTVSNITDAGTVSLTLTLSDNTTASYTFVIKNS